MRISKKAEYALRALAILAAHPAAAHLQAQELATIGRIPVKFLEQILLTLKRGGLLRSKRGVGGGYQLKKQAGEITIAQVILLVDGSLTGEAGLTPGTEAGPGSQGLARCLTELNQIVVEFLERETVQSLLSREEPDGMLAFDI